MSGAFSSEKERNKNNPQPSTSNPPSISSILIQVVVRVFVRDFLFLYDLQHQCSYGSDDDFMLCFRYKK